MTIAIARGDVACPARALRESYRLINSVVSLGQQLIIVLGEVGRVMLQ